MNIDEHQWMWMGLCEKYTENNDEKTAFLIIIIIIIIISIIVLATNLLRDFKP